MPATHILCCGQAFTIEEALAHTSRRDNSCQWTYELLAAMVDHSVAHPSNEDPTRISTTTLTSKCLRQQALARYYDHALDPEKMWASFRGTQFHGQLERFVQPGCYGEVRFGIDDIGKLLPSVKKALPRQDRSFTGSPDLVDPSIGILYDYKRTKEVPRFNSVWPDHVQQLNINRWLIDHADYVEVKGEGKLDMQQPVIRARFVPVEWQELVIVYVDDKGPKPIVVTESIDVPTVDGKRTKKARVPALWSDDQCEELIEQRYVEARLALATHTAPIPVGWEHQSHILCTFCPVSGICAQFEAEGK